MDDNPFETDAIEAADSLDAAGEDRADEQDFDEGDAGDGLDAAGDGLERGEMLDEADVGDDGFDGEGDAMALWDAFESDVADGLDAADEDEFLGRLMGGLGRAAGVLGRGLGGAAGVAGRVRGLASQTGRIADQVGRVAGRVSPAATAAARLARMLGAPGVAGGLQRLAGGARGVQGWAGAAGRLAGAVDQTAGGSQSLFGQLSQLIGGGGDEFDDFDAMADLFEDGVDEALPAAVGLAARAAARGLGFANVAQLSDVGRRALVRGIGAAARELVRARGPRAVRALPRLAQSAARVATRSAPTPGGAARALRRGLPRTARRVAQSPRTLHRLARPSGSGVRRRPAGRTPAPRLPLSRDPQLGRGQPTRRISGARTFYIDGPVALTVTPR